MLAGKMRVMKWTFRCRPKCSRYCPTIERFVRDELLPLEMSVEETGVLRPEIARDIFDKSRALGPENLLGEGGGGLRLIFETLDRIRLAHIGARAVGKAARALAMMTDHARERMQFARPIGDFQLVQQMLADSAMDVGAARLQVLRAAWELDQGGDARTRIAMVKVAAAEALHRVADRAVQIHGGLGYCKDLAIERLYHDARIYDGTSEIHRLSIGSAETMPVAEARAKVHALLTADA